MFCKYCGNQVDDGSLFCPVCGKKLNDSFNTAVATGSDSSTVDRTITVTRLKRMAGWAIKIEVFCDDEYMGILKSGESVSFEVDSQVKHKVYAVSNSSTSTGAGVGITKHAATGSAITATGKSGIIQIQPGTEEVKLNLYLKMGLIVPSIIIEQE